MRLPACAGFWPGFHPLGRCWTAIPPHPGPLPGGLCTKRLNLTRLFVQVPVLHKSLAFRFKVVFVNEFMPLGADVMNDKPAIFNSRRDELQVQGGNFSALALNFFRVSLASIHSSSGFAFLYLTCVRGCPSFTVIRPHRLTKQSRLMFVQLHVLSN